MRSAFLYILFSLISFGGQAQPDPDQFLFGHIHVEVDSGAYTSYVEFNRSGDSLTYNRIHYINEQSGTFFTKPKKVLVSRGMNVFSTVFGIHYLNSSGEDVYLYLFGNREENGIVNVNGKSVALERMDLQKGTYLINWSSNQEATFHQQIQNHVDLSKKKLEMSLDSIQQLVASKRWCSKKKRAEYKYREEEHIRYNYENDPNRFLGYYKVYYTNTVPVDHPFGLDNYVFIITEKAVKQQKVSEFSVSMDEVIQYINSGTCDHPEVARKILESLNE